MLIPAGVRKQLNLQPETEMLLIVEGEEIKVMSVEAARRSALELVARYITPGGPSVVEELLAERRREVEKEMEEDEARLRGR
ncbi:MAG: hypothetical protein HYZ37_12685 [Candidatus Solibacter usitatus]|nr:hypothetical protein [Candidatus Solibacter usitatus]